MGKITTEGGYILIYSSLEDLKSILLVRNILEEQGLNVICPTAKNSDDSFNLFLETQEKLVQNKVYLASSPKNTSGLNISIKLPLKSRLAVKRKLINFSDNLKIYLPYLSGDSLLADRLSECLSSMDFLVISEEIDENSNPTFLKNNFAGTTVIPVTESSFNSKFLNKMLLREDESSLYLVYFGDTWFSSGFGKTRTFGEFYLENVPSEDGLKNFAKAIQDNIRYRLENV